MNIKELKEIIKDLPDDMEVKFYDWYWNNHFTDVDYVKVKDDDDGEFLSIM